MMRTSDAASFKEKFLGDGSIQWGQLYRVVSRPDYILRVDACRAKDGRAVGYSFDGMAVAFAIDSKLDSNELETLAILRGLEALQSCLGFRSRNASVLVYSDATAVVQCVKRAGIPKSATTRKIIYEVDELCHKFSQVGFKSVHRKEVQDVDLACRKLLGLRGRRQRHCAPASQTSIEKSARFNIKELSLDRRAGEQWVQVLGWKDKENEEIDGDG